MPQTSLLQGWGTGSTANVSTELAKTGTNTSATKTSTQAQPAAKVTPNTILEWLGLSEGVVDAYKNIMGALGKDVSTASESEKLAIQQQILTIQQQEQQAAAKKQQQTIIIGAVVVVVAILLTLLITKKR